MSRSPLHSRPASHSHMIYRRYLYDADRIGMQITMHEPVDDLPHVREEVIQDIWCRQEFDVSNLTTVTGEKVVVVDPGRPNSDGGPDFLEAKIEIDDLLWVGAVEIHPASGGWYDHGHDGDPVYDRVILHVSLREDEYTGSVFRSDSSQIPELILYPYLRTSVRKLLYRFYHRSQEDIYCRPFWRDVPSSIRQRWIRWLGLERVHTHMTDFAEAYLEDPDPTHLLYQHVFRALGYAKNSEAMRMLADRVSYDRAQRYADDPERLEALFFGMAGFLAGDSRTAFENESAAYVDRLRTRFGELVEDLDRPPMARSAWQFFRLRPANFPTLRIAQAVTLLRPGRLLYGDAESRLIEAIESNHPVDSLRQLLRVPLPEFWRTHIRLDRPTKSRNPMLGSRRADDIAVNVLLPMVLLYAEQNDRPELGGRVEGVLEEFPAGSDRITRKYEEMGATPASALEAQGMHQLYRTRCSEARCLQCAIGRHIMNKM